MKKVILTIMIVITVGGASSAYQGDIEFKQNDESTFIGKLQGDEWFSWIENKSGNIIKYNNESKNYEYAIIEEVNSEIDLVPSGIAVSSDNSSNAPSDSVVTNDNTIKLLGQIWKRKRNEALDNLDRIKKENLLFTKPKH